MDRKLRRELSLKLRRLEVDIPNPFSPEAYCASLARSRGRPIHLVPWDTRKKKVPCGLWIATTEADYIVYERAAPAILQGQIILHEWCHIFLDHDGSLKLDRLGGVESGRLVPGQLVVTAGLQPGAEGEGVASSFGMLDASTVNRVLGRTSVYEDRQERAAEILASMIGEQATGLSLRRGPHLGQSDAAVLGRFGAALSSD